MARKRKSSTSSSSSSSSRPRKTKRKVKRTKVPRKPTTSSETPPPAESSSSEDAPDWSRLKKLKPCTEPPPDEDEYVDRTPELTRKLQKMVSVNSRVGALRVAVRILEKGSRCDQEYMLGMLENAAASPGTEMFAHTLYCTVVAGNLLLTPEEYCKILGVMIFRKAPVPQIRTFLNVALPKDAKVVPVVPDGITDAEADQMFRDDRAVIEDWMPTDDEDSKQAPSFVTMKRCECNPELDGRYVLCLEYSMPGRPVYQKEPIEEREEDQLFVHYSEKEEAWVITKSMQGKVMMKSPVEGRSPPSQGWLEVSKYGCKEDGGGFFNQEKPPKEPKKKKSSKKLRSDVRSSREALELLDLSQLKGHITCSDPNVAEYFGHFVVLAQLEHLEDMLAVKRRRERSSADQLVRWGFALSGLKVLNTFAKKEANKQTKTLPGWQEVGTEMVAFQMSGELERTRLRRGDSVTISETDPLKDRLTEGAISDVRNGALIVQVRGTFPEDDPNLTWRIDKSANSTVYEREMWALIGLVGAVRVQPMVDMMTAAPVGMADRWALRWQDRGRSPSRSPSPTKEDKRRKRCAQLAMAEVLDPKRIERMQEAQREVEDVDEMNESQKEAIHAAMSRTCTVIQGPPGTGKTSVSVQILNFWSKIMNLTPILATSDSNVAVDNICEGLRNVGVKAVRVGRPEKVRGVVEDMTLEAEIKRLKEVLEEKHDSSEEEEPRGRGGKGGGRQKKKEKNKPKGFERPGMTKQDFEMQMEILGKAEAICTTTIAGGNDFLSKLATFEAILVDEVAQATELSTLVPIVLRGARRLVLVGDHCQLPPSVQSPEAELRGLSVSVYTRLVQAGGVEPFLLDTQYRSHPKLAQFSSEAFYEGNVKTGIKETQRPPPAGVQWPSEKAPIAFVNVEAEEELEGDSKANSTEASLVAEVVAKIIDVGELPLVEIGVVTPYMAQVRRLRQLLRPVVPGNSEFKLLECASVDNFQGREKELIIFSAVRSNSRGNVGFLADWRRLNVMLTRARRGLIIFGNAQTLKQDPIWKKWLAFAERHDCIVDELNVVVPTKESRLEKARAAQEALDAASRGAELSGPAQELAKISKWESRLNMQHEQWEQKHKVAAELLFVNPITSQQEIDLAKKEMRELRERLDELAARRREIMQEQSNGKS